MMAPLLLKLLLLASLNEKCELNSIDLDDEVNFACLKSHRMVKNMKHDFRESASLHFSGKDKYGKLFRQNFLVVGLLDFDQEKYSVILVFKNEPAMYAADLVPANRCSFRITNFEEVPVHPDGPEFMKKTVPELATSSQSWQNAFDDSNTDHKICEPESVAWRTLFSTSPSIDSFNQEAFNQNLCTRNSTWAKRGAKRNADEWVSGEGGDPTPARI